MTIKIGKIKKENILKCQKYDDGKIMLSIKMRKKNMRIKMRENYINCKPFHVLCGQ